MVLTSIETRTAQWMVIKELMTEVVVAGAMGAVDLVFVTVVVMVMDEDGVTACLVKIT